MLGVENVCLIPLEEQVIKRYALASHEVAGIVCRLHGVSFDLNEKVGTFERWDDISLTFVLHHGRIVCECSGHRAQWDKRDAFLNILGNVMRRFNMSLAICVIIFKHITFSCNEPLYVDIWGIGKKSCYIIFADTIALL